MKKLKNAGHSPLYYTILGALWILSAVVFAVERPYAVVSIVLIGAMGVVFFAVGIVLWAKNHRHR